MIKEKLKNLITPINVIAASLLLVLGLSFFAPGVAGADVPECDRTELTSEEYGACLTDPVGWDQSEEESALGIIPLVIDIFSIIVGVIAVIMIIIGGLKYITSNGDSGNVTSAKNTILYAVIGLVIVALAQIIVRFVLSEVGGDND